MDRTMSKAEGYDPAMLVLRRTLAALSLSAMFLSGCHFTDPGPNSNANVTPAAVPMIDASYYYATTDAGAGRPVD
jgi:hypothetical protein